MKDAEEMEVICDCEDWKKYIPKVDGAISLAWSHGMWDAEFKFFIFCPYCGKKLSEK